MAKELLEVHYCQEAVDDYDCQQGLECCLEVLEELCFGVVSSGVNVKAGKASLLQTVPQCPAVPQALSEHSAIPLADPEKRKLVQQQLVLLLHAHECQMEESQVNKDDRHCSLPQCRTMKNVLNHMTTCQLGEQCAVPLCSSSKQIIFHWKNCSRSDCPVCLPLKAADVERADFYVGVSSDVSLEPNTNSGIAWQPPNSVSNAQQSISSPQNKTFGLGSDLNDTNATGQLSRSVDWLASRQLSGQIPTPTLCLGTKEWHQTVTSELRNNLVNKIVVAVLPSPIPNAVLDKRMSSVVAYATQIEAHAYEVANTRSEYYHLLAYKINNIRKKLDPIGADPPSNRGRSYIATTLPALNFLHTPATLPENIIRKLCRYVTKHITKNVI